MTKQNTVTDGFSDGIVGGQMLQNFGETKRGDPHASQDKSQTLYYTASNKSNNNQQQTQEETEQKQPVVLLSEGGENFSGISDPKSWQDVLNIKEAMQQTINELKEQNINFKLSLNKLQEKLEIKDVELSHLRTGNLTLQVENGQLLKENGRLGGELSGLNVIKSLLQEKEVEIKKLNADLIQVTKGSPINLHKQCEQTIRLLETQVKLLEGERDKYRDHRDDLAGLISKRVGCIMNEHMNASLLFENGNHKNAFSPLQTELEIAPKETKSNQDEGSDPEMKEKQECAFSVQRLPSREQLFGFQNIGLTCYAGAALQCAQVLSCYLTGSLLFKTKPYRNQLEQFYVNTFKFGDIRADNDSCEAFSNIVSHYSWSSKLSFKQSRHVVCRSCKIQTITDESHNFVSLQCNGKSLEQCLVDFQKPELLQKNESYDCATCAKKTEAETHIGVSQTNEIFIINLKRHLYKGGVLKNNDIITVPFRMKIESCCYELIAFVLHCNSKTANTGHYKAYVNCSTEWCEFDDDRVRTVKQTELENLANQGYYYFYRRLNESEQRSLSAKPADLIGADQPPKVHCSLCSFDFEHTGAKFQHYTSCQGLKQANERVAVQYKLFAETASEREKQFIQATLGAEGSTLKGAISKVDLIQQQGSVDFKKKFIDDPDLITLAILHEELSAPKYFNLLVHEVIVGPVADAEGNQVYAQNSTREILVSMLGKKNSRKSTSSLEKEVIIKMKKDAGIMLTLDERRSIEAEEIKTILHKHDSDIMHIRDYLGGFREMGTLKAFTKVKTIFCDGIILPRLEQLFKTYNDFESAFHSVGIQVQKVCPGQKDGFVYVRLQDSANEFNNEFFVKLKALVQRLRKQLEDLKESQEVTDACFVQQIDCTQDMKGFFLSFDVKNDIFKLSKLMSMGLTHDYPSFESLFTLLKKQNYGTEEEPLMLKQTRFKLYNKLLHFLESEQGKKKISMNLKGLLNCSSEFYQKLRECFESGLSRLEYSHYFYSFEESCKIEIEQYQKQIDHAFEQVNKLPQIRFDVPFKMFFNRFWNCSRPVFVFQRDSWTVVYAKHSISAYIGQTVKITQGRFDNKDKNECVKRFGIPGKWCAVIDEATGKVYKVMKTGSKLMQIPIQSMNTAHSKSYDFPFNEGVFKYHVNNKELNEVKLVFEDGTEFKFEEIANSLANKMDEGNVQVLSRKREHKQTEKQGIDVTELLEDKRISNKRYKVFNLQGQPKYGSLCKFSSQDVGRTYICESCSMVIKAQGSMKKPLLLFV